jgi:hypothetical protein
MISTSRKHRLEKLTSQSFGQHQISSSHLASSEGYLHNATKPCLAAPVNRIVPIPTVIQKTPATKLMIRLPIEELLSSQTAQHQDQSTADGNRSMPQPPALATLFHPLIQFIWRSSPHKPRLVK